VPSLVVVSASVFEISCAKNRHTTVINLPANAVDMHKKLSESVTVSVHGCVQCVLFVVMKIRWFASQNATYFRVLANQFDICAHSGANHYITSCTRKRQRHIYQRAVPQSDCIYLYCRLVACQELSAQNRL